jgi:hypothetical protein
MVPGELNEVLERNRAFVRAILATVEPGDVVAGELVGLMLIADVGRKVVTFAAIADVEPPVPALPPPIKPHCYSPRRFG